MAKGNTGATSASDYINSGKQGADDFTGGSLGGISAPGSGSAQSEGGAAQALPDIVSNWASHVAIRGMDGLTAYADPEQGRVYFPNGWNASSHRTFQPSRASNPEWAREFARKQSEYDARHPVSMEAVRQDEAATEQEMPGNEAAAESSNALNEAIKAAAEDGSILFSGQMADAGPANDLGNAVFSSGQMADVGPADNTAFSNQVPVGNGFPVTAAPAGAQVQFDGGPATPAATQGQGRNQNAPNRPARGSSPNRGRSSSNSPQGYSNARQSQNGTVPSAQPTDPESRRKLIEDIWSRTFYSASRAARGRNASLRRAASAKGMSLDDYLRSEGKGLDPEGFEDFKSIQDEMYGKIPEVSDTGVGKTFKEHKNLWRMMDSLVWDLKIGFFHVSGEQLKYSKDGNPYVSYSKAMLSKIGQVERMFGLSANTFGRRTVFRMVRLYASMSTDFSGKLFNQEKSEWTMSESEFMMICDLMMESANKSATHNPFTMVRRNATLGGTNIYPSGVIPIAVASAICNKNSCIDMSAQELIEDSRRIWNTSTYPQMRKDLSQSNRSSRENNEEGPNLTAQRIVIEGMQQALSRIDGMTAAEFSSSYNVDTSDHYRISEYLSEEATYAQVMNGNYDSDIVKRRGEAKVVGWSNRYADDGYNTVRYNNDGTIELEGRISETNTQWGLRVFTSLVRTNAIFGQIGIMIGMIGEKIITVATTGAWTSLTLRHYNKDNDYDMTKQALSIIRSDDFKEAMGAAKMLFDLYGPGAMRLYGETGKPMRMEDVGQWLINEYLPDAPSETKARIEQKVNQFTNKFMAGDFILNGADCVNWYKSYLIQNAVQADVQRRLAGNNRVDKMGIALTGSEIEDTLLHAGDVSYWLAEALRTDNGIGAYIAMRGNSIANINPASFAVSEYFSKHRVKEAVITAFLDHFPKYGINMLLNLVPFCKTIQYIMVKRTGNESIVTDSDLVIGGNLGSNQNGIGASLMEDPGYQAGLIMNLTYDLIAMGRVAIVVPFIRTLAILAMGLDEPDDKRNMTNFWNWKIGGIEYEKSFFMNDIELWSDPISNATAVMIKTGDIELARQIFINSSSQMLDGNVLIDVVNVVNNWQEDLETMQKMADDPDYDGPDPTPSAVVSFLSEYLLFAKNGITPGAPLMRTVANSSLLRGDDALRSDPSREWNKDSDWAIENRLSRYISDPDKRFMNKMTMYDPILGLGLDLFDGIFGGNGGHFWSSMPPRSTMDPLTFVYMDAVDFDYSKRGDMTEQEYAKTKLDEYRSFVESEFTGPQNAIEKGFWLPNENRVAFSNAINAECNMLDNDLLQRVASGEVIFDSDEYWDIKTDYSKMKKKLQAFNNQWVWNYDIPAGYQRYDQLLTDYSYRYYDTEANRPTDAFDYMMSHFVHGDGRVVKEYFPKGNHPTSVLPFTAVETEGRGYNAETLNYWEDESSDLEGIRNGIGNTVVPIGRWAGKTVNDLIFGGEQPDFEPYSTAGEYTNPDQSTMSERSWVAHPIKADLSLKEDRTDSDGGIYGESGTMTPEVKKLVDAMNSGDISSLLGTVLPYGGNGWNGNGGGYSYYGGGNGGISYGSYTPRIYSNPRSLNSSRPSTMYAKTPYGNSPTSYLRPSYATKGSRESYRRNDL